MHDTPIHTSIPSLYDIISRVENIGTAYFPSLVHKSVEPYCKIPGAELDASLNVDTAKSTSPPSPSPSPD